MLKQVSRILAVGLVAAMLFSGCSSKNATSTNSATSGQTGGTLNFGLSAEPANLDPAKQAGTAQREVKLCIYRGLFNYYTDGKLTNELAQSYTVSSDGLTYTFKLRDAKFQNGDSVTAADVKYTFDRTMDVKTGATNQKLISNMVSSVEAVDTTTVKVVLKQINAAFISYLALPEMAIVSQKWTVAHNGDLSANPMGAGPFSFVSWTKGQGIVLKKFTGYYEKGKPMLDGINFKFYSDDNTRVTALYGGDADMIEYVPFQNAAAIEANKNYAIQKTSGPFMLLEFNTTFKPFSNPKVREAIGYAINRQTIIDTAFSGQGTAIWGLPIQKGAVGYDAKYTNYFSYDTAKAKQLLTEAGYPNGFTAKLLSTAQYSYHQQTAVVVQSELKKIGIDVTLVLPDWATRQSKNVKGDYDFMVSGTNGDITDPDWLRDFFGVGGGNNTGFFSDDKVTSLLDQGVGTLDTTKRNTIYSQFDQQALDLSPFVFLNYRNQSYAMSKKVGGFKNLPGNLTFQSGITLQDTYLSK